jgi:hypothetical protein
VPDEVIDRLLRSEEPSVRWLVRTRVLGEPPESSRLRQLRREISRSPRVQRLLAGREADGRLMTPQGVYAKWQGAHWVLGALADLGYPPGDRSLEPMRDQVLDHWLAPRYRAEIEATGKKNPNMRQAVPVIDGRHRRCASQQGNALRSVVALGLADERCDEIVDLLYHWQWPDGGWNCDKNPSADTSSFCETLLPMRGLAAYARVTGAGAARDAALRAAEVFLTRQVVFRRSTGKLIHPEFAVLHFPLYWHYDVLGGLTGLFDVDAVRDPRCAAALDLLESKRLPDGGWPADKKYYRAAGEVALGNDYVDWGGTSTRRMNEWVTVAALAVLRAAGRLT